MQSFSPRLITCGALGYLRQEFRELELLDEITKLRYEGNLPDHIQGNFRNPLIRAYQKWKGTDYVPSLTHPALKWSIKDPMSLLSVVTDAHWQIIEKKIEKEVNIETTSMQSGFVAAKGSVPVKSVAVKGSVSVKSEQKRRLEEAEILSASVKKLKTAQMIIGSNYSSLLSGLIWDSVRNMVMNMVIKLPFLLSSYFYIYFKTFSLFLGNVICLETVLQLFTNHCCFIQNCCAKLATERKLRGVSTYLPVPEALCSKRVWNTRSATTISIPRPRPAGGQEYIPMSLFDS